MFLLGASTTILFTLRSLFFYITYLCHSQFIYHVSVIDFNSICVYSLTYLSHDFSADFLNTLNANKYIRMIDLWAASGNPLISNTFISNAFQKSPMTERKICLLNFELNTHERARTRVRAYTKSTTVF